MGFTHKKKTLTSSQSIQLINYISCFQLEINGQEIKLTESCKNCDQREILSQQFVSRIAL